jgi:RimJ/RimL family protein N-acetyltransferase
MLATMDDDTELTPGAPRLLTERLLMRGWLARDLPLFAALNADPEVMEHFVDVQSPGVSDQFVVERIASVFADRGFGTWAVDRLDTGEFVGMVGLLTQDFPAHFTPCVEVGWRLARQYWGHGLATEAARRSMEYGFATAGLDEIVSMTAMTNTRSQAVMQRLGMTRDPTEDFDHPRVPAGHRVERHVLYRMPRRRWEELPS